MKALSLLHRNLRADLHDSIRGKLKITARVVGILGKEDEQPVLPKVACPSAHPA
jgi:hypothetical protein